MQKLLPLLCLCLTLQGLSAQNFVPAEMIVNASKLNLRETPDVSGKKVGTVPKGAVVQVLEAANDGEYVMAEDTLYAPWFKVSYKGKTGYAFGHYLSNTWNLYYEDEIVDGDLPNLNWYGVFTRDSFADELRKIEVHTESTFFEYFASNLNVLKTNQPQASKLVIGTIYTMPTGNAGPLGVFHLYNDYHIESLAPGAMAGVAPGQEPNDTIYYPTYVLAATGCAKLNDHYVHVEDYQLLLIDYYTEPYIMQDLSEWVRPFDPEFNPSVTLTWYGDLDGDHKADFILHDCPAENCRASLYLSSKAKPGNLVEKVCEHYFPMD
ncbi:MAG: SH3 domain-containing protein [Lewinellaceae bacterium]|nr:SH3 domain-containing protein [Lewinellaceae bacterium]